MATIRIGRTPVVLLFRPEHVRYVLTENPTNFTNREVAGGLVFGNLLVLSLLAESVGVKAVQGLQALVGDSLLTTDGDFHDRHRRIMQSAFSRPSVERHAGLIVEYTRDMMEHWRNGAELDLTKDIQALILRITAGVILDFDVKNTPAGLIIEGILNQPVTPLEALLNLPIRLPFTPYSRRLALIREGDDFMYSVMDRRSPDDGDGEDILSILLRATDETGGAALTRQQIRDELTSLLGAGYETTTNTVLWTLYLLARHPSILQMVQEELRSELGARAPGARDLSRLTFLDCVVKESMRLYPSAWTQGRHAISAFELGGYHFPAGTLLMFSQWVLHRLPDVWGDPHTFRPDRWESVHRQKLPRWAYFPYGVGPRSCLGMSLAQLEIPLVLATVLQRYSLAVPPERPVIPVPLITLRQRDALRVRIAPASR